MKNIVLSIDTQCLNNPSLLDLDGIQFNYDWLKVFTDASMFRNYINSSNSTLEIWIVSNDDIEAINLAATAKKDRPDCVVCLVSYDLNGSLKSRAEAANIDVVLNLASFKERFLANIKANSYSEVQKDNLNEFKLRNIPNISTDNHQNQAFVLSIVSASGGSGKSSVAAMCAYLTHAAGLKTLVIDADFQFGDLDMILGPKTILTIDELVSNRGAVTKLKSNSNMPCLLAPPSLPEYSEKLIEEFPAILESLKPLFDVIVINTNNYWNEQQAILLEHDSKSIFLVDQRPSSVNSTKKVINLCSRCGIATGSVLFAINRCSKRSLFSSIDISCALEGAPVAEILDGGVEVDEYMSSGEAYELIKSRNPFALSLWNIIENILPENLLASTKINLSKQKKRKNQKPTLRKRA